MTHCRLCGKGLHDVMAGIWFMRMSPKGQKPAVWECRPGCDQPIDDPDPKLAALVAAVRGTPGETIALVNIGEDKK